MNEEIYFVRSNVSGTGRCVINLITNATSSAYSQNPGRDVAKKNYETPKTIKGFTLTD